MTLQGAFSVFFQVTDPSIQAVYIFDPTGDDAEPERPLKRRKVDQGKGPAASDPAHGATSAFVPLLNGAELPEWVGRREELFNKCWSRVNADVQVRSSHPVSRLGS